MIGRIFGAIAGSQVAKHSRSLGSGSGAILGAAAVPIMSRMRIPALLALGAGGYVVKKLIDRNKLENSEQKDASPAG